MRVLFVSFQSISEKMRIGGAVFLCGSTDKAAHIRFRKGPDDSLGNLKTSWAGPTIFAGAATGIWLFGGGSLPSRRG